jgi:S1-C subfamily serine protease
MNTKKMTTIAMLAPFIVSLLTANTALAVSKNGTTPAITPDEAVNIRVYKSTNQGVVHVATMAQAEDFLFNVVPREGFGSGSIINSSGYILTNNHVVAGAQKVRITLYDGTNLPADVVGADAANDIAVLKITPPAGMKLTAIPLGDSANLEVGRRVFAIGNPFGLDRTLTQGIISSIGRTLGTGGGRLIKGIIQTDAAINPGNSGGPLLDTQGKMIGINTAIFSRAGQSAGIGFAIPINIAKRLIPELIAHHAIVRPDLGILQVQQTDKGLRVVTVDPNGPAAQAGIKGRKLVVSQQGPFTVQSIDYASADIINSIDNQPVRTPDDLLSYIDNKQAGQIVTLGVLRQGKLTKIPVKLVSSNTQ